MKKLFQSNSSKLLRLALLFSVIATSSCSDDETFEQKRHQIFREEPFINDVIKSLNHYEELMTFIDVNKDTLIEYSPPQESGKSSYGNGAQDWISFNTLTQIPPSLDSTYQRLIAQINHHRFWLAELRYGVVSIYLNDPNENPPDPRINIAHRLHLNRQLPTQDTCISMECSLRKDTILQHGICYSITVHRKLGILE